MSVTTWGWLIIAFPLAGSVLIGLLFRVLPAKAAGWIGTLAIALAFACSIGALLAMLGHPAEEREFANTLYDYAGAAGIPFDLGIYVDQRGSRGLHDWTWHSGRFLKSGPRNPLQGPLSGWVRPA